MICCPIRDKIMKMNQLVGDINKCEKYLQTHKDCANPSESKRAEIAKMEKAIEKMTAELKTIARHFSFLPRSVRLILSRLNDDYYNSDNTEIDPYLLFLVTCSSCYSVCMRSTKIIWLVL